MKNIVIVSFLLCFACQSWAADQVFHQDQPLLDRLLVEGVRQKFLRVRVQALANIIKSFADTPNSWDQPAVFKISNQSGENFEFEGVKSGTFSEPPMCEDYEIHFSGTFNKKREKFQWELGPIEIKFLNRTQCL